MSFDSFLLDLRTHPGRLPVLEAVAPGDAGEWATEQRGLLQQLVAEHGAVMVRGLGLRDAAGVGAVVEE
jgi:hypothetical protein